MGFNARRSGPGGSARPRGSRLALIGIGSTGWLGWEERYIQAPPNALIPFVKPMVRRHYFGACVALVCYTPGDVWSR